MVIGISGKIGSGKDTVGSIIQYLTSKDNGIGGAYLHKLQESDRRLFGNYDTYLNKSYPVRVYKSNWEIKKFADALKEICSILTGIPRADFEKEEVKNSLLGEEWSFDREYVINPKGSELEESDGVEYTRKIPTIRWLLQTVGTEAMRNCIHEDVWVNALFNEYKSHHSKSLYDFMKEKYKVYELNDNYYASTKHQHEKEWNETCTISPNWVITDLRFPNELKVIEGKNGITIRVNRFLKTQQHLVKSRNGGYINSEGPTDNHPFETSLDNATFKYTIDNNGTIEELVEKVKEILILEKII